MTEVPQDPRTDTASPVTAPVEEHSFWLVLDKDNPEGQFKAKSKVNRWAFISLAASAKKDENAQAAAMYELAHSILIDEEHARFDAYMMQDDDSYDKLDEAMTEWARVVAGRPLERSSSSQPTSTDMPPLSRVVSLSQGTQDQLPMDESPTETSSSND